MKYTNKNGLPDALVRAVENDPYDKGDADFSATELLKPPQITHLYDKHCESLSEDVSDAVYRLLGSGVHNVLERAYEGSEDHTETRLFAEIGGHTISGSPDLREPGKITDYKVTGTYKVIKGGHEDWEAQLNIYQWLCRKNGYQDIDKLEIVVILRDWMKSKQWKTGYPRSPVKIIPMHRWTPAKQEQFIKEKIREHTAEVPRQCTYEETWRGKRCKDWCLVAKFCPQYNKIK